jgi:hypothetical protein
MVCAEDDRMEPAVRMTIGLRVGVHAERGDGPAMGMKMEDARPLRAPRNGCVPTPKNMLRPRRSASSYIMTPDVRNLGQQVNNRCKE